MTDPRIKTLAKNLIGFSCAVKPGEKILIEGNGECTELVKALVKETYAAGGVPFVWIKKPEVCRELALGATKEQQELMAKIDCELMRHMDAYIGIGAKLNTNEMSDVPGDKLALISAVYGRPLNNIRIPNTKWCVLRYPNPNFAQMAGMSTEAFEDFYFNVCNLDYAKMDKAMQPLKELMEKTDRVHIVGPGTDLRFSIKGMPAIKCSGQMNIPDGEIYTAPVDGSVEGTITYNTPSIMDGFTYENVSLTFKNGRIVESTSNDNERIKAVFDRDAGARGVGEFAIGVNPYVTFPAGPLFDRKASDPSTASRAAATTVQQRQQILRLWDLVAAWTPNTAAAGCTSATCPIHKDGEFVLPPGLPQSREPKYNILEHMDKDDLKAGMQAFKRKGLLSFAIDGNNNASGKTTLAEELREEFSARVFHCDDYFLQPYQRTERRLNETGGSGRGDFGKKWRNPQGCTGTRNAANIFAGQANCPLHLR